PLRMPTTVHKNGDVHLNNASRTHGFKPLLGFEAYLRDDLKPDAVRYERNHLTLLAANDTGFRNLVKLTSAGFLQGQRRGKSNVDMELPSEHSGGVSRLTGCPQPPLSAGVVAAHQGAGRGHGRRR